MKVFRSDGGGEFVNRSVHEFFSSKGVLHQRSCPHTSEHNGVVEQKHMSIVDIVVFLLNRLPSNAIGFMASF